MKKLFAMALSGLLSAALLAGCASDTQPTATPDVSASLPAVSESVTPQPEESILPEESQQPEESIQPSEQPEETPSAQPSAKPTATPSAKPSAKPSAAPTTKPTAKPTATPKPTAAPTATPAPTPETSVVQSVWNEISALDMPMMTTVNDALLSSIYGINASDLVEYVCKMPAMNTTATEFFIGEVKDGKMDTVKAALEARQDALDEEWSKYLPEQYELVQNYQLVTSGNYVIFVISDQADEAVSAFNTYAK
ncbi:MAG TPA: DUF4358 domain-containing protein [Candidatus Flavonifractor merdipullorum]|uniref:DUF4358 domain-containing protein n=1 Tax=Candidatus Flavonifractor merdipullorum TaxID=2838590 RepID=A0A9D1UMZ9_9FIRM|nr:DUF4358 domain-containing protein [Candidatus Flavonifractor merdipullorum]